MDGETVFKEPEPHTLRQSREGGLPGHLSSSVYTNLMGWNVVLQEIRSAIHDIVL